MYNIFQWPISRKPTQKPRKNGNNKCQRAKATKLWKSEENMTFLLPSFIERELRCNASDTAEYISDTSAVMEEPDCLGSSEDTTLLPPRYCL
jgi:hypothetical protein